MKCVFNLVLMVLLTTTLVIAASYGVYARTAHVLSNAENQTIVICGAGGQAETITLDRNGNPVESPIKDCAHCDDCGLVPIVDLTGPVISARPEGFVSMAWILPTAAPRALREIESPSRGPPNQKVM